MWPTGHCSTTTAAARLAGPAGATHCSWRSTSRCWSTTAVIDRRSRPVAGAHRRDRCDASTPPTLSGLLTARLHRLPPDERERARARVGDRQGLPGRRAGSLTGDRANLGRCTFAGCSKATCSSRPGESGASEEAYRVPSPAAARRRLRIATQVAPRGAARALRRSPREIVPGAAATSSTRSSVSTSRKAHDYRSALGAHDETRRSRSPIVPAQRLSVGRRPSRRTRRSSRGDPIAPARGIAGDAEPGARAAIRLRLCHALGDAADTAGYVAALDVRPR